MQFGWSRRRKMQASRVHYWQCLHTVSKLHQGNFQNPTCKPTSHGTGVQSESWKSYPRSLDVVQSGLKPVLKESRDLSFPTSQTAAFVPGRFSGVVFWRVEWAIFARNQAWSCGDLEFC